ncbi:MAG TPA: hypothetical protein VG013_37350 [Gemmataceae bacterium]|jgi:hypothetical protein|nr:hypothetical protein [Gemmataceae bacterium]
MQQFVKAVAAIVLGLAVTGMVQAVPPKGAHDRRQDRRQERRKDRRQERRQDRRQDRRADRHEKHVNSLR